MLRDAVQKLLGGLACLCACGHELRQTLRVIIPSITQRCALHSIGCQLRATTKKHSFSIRRYIHTLRVKLQLCDDGDKH
eukprot:scaffold215066_cov14-Prasinocladus_malaysianus.AAC.1